MKCQYGGRRWWKKAELGCPSCTVITAALYRNNACVVTRIDIGWGMPDKRGRLKAGEVLSAGTRFSADRQPQREEKPCWNREWCRVMIQLGKTASQMAKESGVTRANIHYWVKKKHGLSWLEGKK